MLQSLSIRNIVLVEQLDLELGGGLTVLTGETGAGKSILLDAMGLALGARADAGLVRAGADKGQVIAAFELPSGSDLLQQHELEADDDQIILRRSLTSDGRSRAFVNDQPVSAKVLRALGDALMEIHGQHDDRGLLDPKGHRILLDQFGGLEKQAAKVAAAWRDWRKLQRELDDAKARLENAEVERDYLTHVLKELEDLQPEAGEEDSLADKRQLMMNAEKLGEDVDAAIAALEGTQNEDGVERRLATALHRLERAAEKAGDALTPAVEAVTRALTEAGEALAAVDEARREIDHDPAELERIEDRLFALRGLARKHQARVDDLPVLMEKFQADLEAIEGGTEHLAGLETAAADAQKLWLDLAKALSAARVKAGKKLDKAVMTELGPLKLDKARFETVIYTGGPEEGGAHGLDDVHFAVATNPGSKPGPLIKIASGGELSRFILALKVSLADQKAEQPSMVFDEVDRGIGGATADAVGERLQRLADDGQLLVVTHSPQVAARGSHHFHTAKTTRNGGKVTVTEVTPLAPEDRREELARMLAGAEVTDEARAAASKLLEQVA